MFVVVCCCLSLLLGHRDDGHRDDDGDDDDGDDDDIVFPPHKQSPE